MIRAALGAHEHITICGQFLGLCEVAACALVIESIVFAADYQLLAVRSHVN